MSLSARQTSVVALLGRPGRRLTYKEAAAQLGIAVGTVYVHAFQARRKLRVDDLGAAYEHLKKRSTRRREMLPPPLPM